jgi:predicted NBD/HSP70 family sugar kinase
MSERSTVEDMHPGRRIPRADRPAYRDAFGTKERIFGLSLDRSVEWATAETDGRRGVDFASIRRGTFENVTLDPPREENFDLQDRLKTALVKLKDDGFPFKECKAVGVSTIGVVHPETKRLLCIIMKELFPKKPKNPEEDPYLVDFKELFFDKLGVENREHTLIVHNETTAAALAEYYQQRHEDIKAKLSPMVYLKFDEGVNGGIIVKENPLATQLNTEMGHMYPLRHQLDRNFDGVCPIHGACYEGLASNRRLRARWRGKTPRSDFTLVDLPTTDPAWEIIAYYIAQLSWAAMMVASPQRIILGGAVISGRDDDSRQKVYKNLFPRIWANFERLNKGKGSPTYYRPSQPYYGPAEDFIRSGLVKEYASLMGALSVAATSPALFGSQGFVPVDQQEGITESERARQ